MFGGLAQLARAPALQAGGQRFESVILHSSKGKVKNEKRKIKWIFHSSLLTFHFTSVFDILIQAKL